MNTALLGNAALDAPFPGLRAFEAEETLLFYGREIHVTELLDRLGEARFVAVTGTSGSGKSSLVRAGLHPALQRGYLLDATTRWRFATMRPGSAPLEALSEAVVGALGRVDLDETRRLLKATSAGLTEAVARGGLEHGESLLVIADQFEELFRFDVTREQEANAAQFVSLLLEASEQRMVPIYVVATMRSEFLGRCSEFLGLAEAFNRSQYMVPRLTRDGRRDAIERPLKLFGVAPSPALVQQALNDAGDDPDQLPVLQHALLRTYGAWQKAGATGRLEREHYQAIGGVDLALDNHADELFASMSAGAQKVTERLFRSLTVSQGGVALRRPRRMRELYAVAGATTADGQRQVDEIVQTFAHRQNSFLMLSSRTLTPETVADITHESLIRKWKRLKTWVREERRSAEWYADLARDVVRYRAREVSLWQDPELSGIAQRRQDEGWNDAWAEQYRRADDPAFPEVASFLDESARAQTERRRLEEEQRSRELRQAQALARLKRYQSITLALLLVAVAGAAMLFYLRNRDAQQSIATAQTYAETANAAATADARAKELEAQLTAALSTSATAGTPIDSRRIDELNQQVKAAQDSAQRRQDELDKLKKDQASTASDRGALLRQVQEMTQRLASITDERDRLLKGASAVSTSQRGSEGRVQELENQLRQESSRSSEKDKQITTLSSEVESLRRQVSTLSRSTAVGGGGTTQDVTRAFTEGVRAFDAKNWQGAARYMREAIAVAGGDAPKEVRMSGTRRVPFAPNSYLGAALYQMKTGCAEMQSTLAQSRSEPRAVDAQGSLEAAKKQCGVP